MMRFRLFHHLHGSRHHRLRDLGQVAEDSDDEVALVAEAEAEADDEAGKNLLKFFIVWLIW